MAYSDERNRVGRIPFQMVKLSLDYCPLAYGESPCTAGRFATGQLQSATSTTAVLDVGASAVDDAYNKMKLVITGGTGSGQAKFIDNYVGATQTVELKAGDTWTTTPDATSTYDIIDTPNACYNTRDTCQDAPTYIDNYDPDIHDVYLTERTSDFPVTLLNTANLAVAIPCLKSAKITPPKIDIGKGLGLRGALTITCDDFPHHDRGMDPYFESRAYDPVSQGTFWGKFIARNTYYSGRYMTLYRGYLNADGTFDATNFETYLYIIDKIKGVSNSDTISITGKDILKKIDTKRAQVPSPSQETLLLDITDADTSATLSVDPDTVYVATGEPSYPTSGYARMGEEIVAFTRSGATLTLTRAQYGTLAEEHKSGDSFQYCIEYISTNVMNILQDLLDVAKRSTDFGYDQNAGIDTAFLNLVDWATEKSTWFNNNNLSNIISKPTSVEKLISALLSENMLYMWWDPVSQLVELKAIVPDVASTFTTVDDDNNIIENTLTVDRDPEQRISQVWVYYTPRDNTEDKRENYANLYIATALSQENPEKYNEARVKVIESRWIKSEAIVTQIAGRLLSLFKNDPHIVQFQLDNKDDVELGDKISLTTRFIQNADGSKQNLDMLITESSEVKSGSINQFKAQQFTFYGTYGFIAPSHTGEIRPGSSGATVVLDTRTSKWDPSGEVRIVWDEMTGDITTLTGPDVAVNGISIPDPTIDVPVWAADFFDNCYFEIHSGIHSGFSELIVAFDPTTFEITLAGSTPGSEVGEFYHIHMPEWQPANLLKEDGGDLLKEDGSLIALEETSATAPTDAQKSKYIWIAPDSGYFDDGTEAYKIL